MKQINLFAIALSCSLLSRTTAETWSSFRGPLGTGLSSQSLPTKWNEKSIAWRAEIEGSGQSSAVNWGNKIFLTSAKDNGLTRLVLCLDASNGKVLWKKTIEVDAPEQSHKMNSWATPSCATDGERVVAFFGKGGLHCFDLDGKPLWSRIDLGSFPGNWGIAASPLILDGKVIQNCDAEGNSYLLAVDKKTGETVWITPRKSTPKGGWSTPILIDTGKRKELVLNGEFGVQAYDPETGKDYWFCKSFNGRGSPVPFFANNLVYVVNGQPGDLYVVKPGGEGDVTDTHMAYHAKRVGGRDLPSPVVVGNYLFVVSLSGIATTYNALDGEIYYSERLGGSFSASPMVANGLAYLLSEAGETVVVRPGKTLDIVSRNNLGLSSEETFRAAISPIDGRLFLRSSKALYCIMQ
ncbi:MAG: PQQ-binding-like beta-propeller repeat protein [Planctomycetota bacterium]|nr:PQQ-binding-like beta-propeller repeat protein [Planctomycetota bacterium]MDA1136965.1 PQQ-binding-like beta-propeller repeat protein [Planctomycetota bacterium]